MCQKFCILKLLFTLQYLVIMVGYKDYISKLEECTFLEVKGGQGLKNKTALC